MINNLPPEKSAGIIIIGDEILSGRVHDSNGFYLASELRNLGVKVKIILVLPDDKTVIGREVRTASDMYDYVFTSGGIGPTHDDVTMAGIADGFGVKLISHPELEHFFTSHYSRPLNKAVLKMAQVPEGAEVIMEGGMKFPLILFRNIYIFPGIPEYLRNKFSAVKERFRSPSFHIKKLFLAANESEIAGSLSKIAESNTDVAVGSYPVLGESDYKIIVTIESKSVDSMNKALEQLLGVLKGDYVVKVE